MGMMTNSHGIRLVRLEQMLQLSEVTPELPERLVTPEERASQVSFHLHAQGLDCLFEEACGLPAGSFLLLA